MSTLHIRKPGKRLRIIGRSLLPGICHETVFDTQNNESISTAICFLVQDLPCAQWGGQSRDCRVSRSPGFTVVVHKTHSTGAGAVPNDLLRPAKGLLHITFDMSLLCGVPHRRTNWHKLWIKSTSWALRGLTPPLGASLFPTSWTPCPPAPPRAYLLSDHTLCFCESEPLLTRSLSLEWLLFHFQTRDSFWSLKVH